MSHKKLTDSENWKMLKFGPMTKKSEKFGNLVMSHMSHCGNHLRNPKIESKFGPRMLEIFGIIFLK